MKVSSAILLNIGIDPNATERSVSSLTELRRINVFAIILPSLALLQSAMYIGLIYRLVKQGRQLQLQTPSLPNDNKIEWVKNYESRVDEFSYKSHRKLFDNFDGQKREINSQ